MAKHNIISKKSFILGVAAIFMAAAYAGQNECYVLQETNCLRIGGPCSAVYQGTSYPGKITDAADLLMCRRGAPGNRKCANGSVDRTCTYKCTIQLSGGSSEELEQIQIQKTPVLSGATCQTDG